MLTEGKGHDASLFIFQNTHPLTELKGSRPLTYGCCCRVLPELLRRIRQVGTLKSKEILKKVLFNLLRGNLIGPCVLLTNCRWSN